MQKLDFNQDWTLERNGVRMGAVTLPHDAMLHEQRDPNCPNGKTTGYYPGGLYRYTRHFQAPAEWADQSVLLECEGVYQNAAAVLNGRELARQPYGYTGFTVDLSDALRFDAENELVITADTRKEPFTRWYSGSGIYRPVWLYVGAKDHIDVDGVEITTVSANPPTIRIRTRAGEGTVAVTVLDAGETPVQAEGRDVTMTLPDAKLWSAEEPNRYRCVVTLKSADGEIRDEQTVWFGICELRWSTAGLMINGVETKLRGACIHHDNGVLGACEFPAAARRRVRILKEAGFNAIRSAHNPISKAMLSACDELGLYVMDEFTDMWYEHKNRGDYAAFFEDWYERDLTAMIRKDVSHPCVVMYSIGNEVTETAEPAGIDYTKKMTQLCHRLDASRPVTCGINMALNVMHFAGLGVYRPAEGEAVRPPEPKNPKALAILAGMQKARAQQAEDAPSDSSQAATAALGMRAEDGTKQDGKLVGSEYFNKIMVSMKEQQQAVVKQDIAKILSEDAYAALDIAGYNYAITRYELDAEEYPGRISVGTETLPQKIYANWQHVTACPYSVGDFIWTGWDYIGEAGVGIFCYDSIGEKDGAYPDLLAGSGIIDILGHCRPEVWLNKAVYGLDAGPYIGVEPVTHADENHIISAWRYSDAVHSWSWKGCEGRIAQIVVYANAQEIELLQDGVSLGRQPVNECQTAFSAEYRPGTLTAVAYDVNGREIGRDELRSAGTDLRLCVQPDKTELCADGQDLCYLEIALTDENGIVEAGDDRKVRLTVSGAGTLAGFGSAAPCTEERFTDGLHTTYYGRALAVVRAGYGQPGEIRVTAEADGMAPVCVCVNVR